MFEKNIFFVTKMSHLSILDFTSVNAYAHFLQLKDTLSSFRLPYIYVTPSTGIVISDNKPFGICRFRLNVSGSFVHSS